MRCSLSKFRAKIFLALLAVSLIGFALVAILNTVSLTTNLSRADDCEEGNDKCVSAASIDCEDGRDCLLHRDCKVCMDRYINI